MNNSLGKKTLNLSNQYNDSSIYEFNNSLGNVGVGGNRHITTGGVLNLTNLLRQNILEDDGIEDLHFYQVQFNKHKAKVLKGMEEKGMIEQLRKERYERGEIDCKEDLKVKED